MNNTISDSLIEFSNKHDLLNRTKTDGLKCLSDWFKENPEEPKQLFPKLKPEDFIFDDASQTLIFLFMNQKTFIVRTTYSLFTTAKDKDDAVGFYTLEVNEDGEALDDYLHFD